MSGDASVSGDATASDARYDFVIVGGGSAGCVLANRISADPACKVLVLEAGRPDAWWDLLVHMPAALALPLGSRFYDWRYRSEPEPHMAGRQIYHARGKVLGGSSSINGMIFQRGNALDYDGWAAEPGVGDIRDRRIGCDGCGWPLRIQGRRRQPRLLEPLRGQDHAHVVRQAH